ncbi:hypothetical protein HN011_002266 [Eciton burchellii]|nr:hypothetical protein HN011_002266 [Eciton burchellii]
MCNAVLKATHSLRVPRVPLRGRNLFGSKKGEREEKQTLHYEFVKIHENWKACLADRENEARPLKTRTKGREARSMSISDRRTMNNNATISASSEKKEP